MKIGYARVSTEDQNLDLQIDALKKAGCEKIFSDQMSGAKADRPGLLEALTFCREGDTFTIWKLDRLGRSVKQLVDFVNNLQEKKIEFISTTDSINTSTPAGRFFFHTMAALAQMERELTIERTHAGLAAARARGRVGGRKEVLTESKMKSAKQLLAGGHHPKDVAKNLGVSLSTLYRKIPGASSLNISETKTNN